MGRRRRSNVYRHFMLHEDVQTSTCLLCYKTLKTVHGSNLMHHLKFLHKVEYKQVLALNSGAIPPVARNSPNSNDDESNQSDADVEVDIEKFFAINRALNCARCEICQAVVDTAESNLINHLKREHPKMLKPANDDSDTEHPDPEDLFQEVVYLYDSDSKSSNAKPHAETTNPISTQKHQGNRKTRHLNRPSVSFGHMKRRRTEDTATKTYSKNEGNQFTEELENFGKYVTCLLKTVPEDLCTQLQMDIINLIMTAKIKNRSKSDASMSIVENAHGVSAGPFDSSHSGDAIKVDNVNDTVPSPESNMNESSKIELTEDS